MLDALKTLPMIPPSEEVKAEPRGLGRKDSKKIVYGNS